MIFNSFNWVMLLLLIISMVYTNTSKFREKLDKLEKEKSKILDDYNNEVRRRKALERMISIEGYTYEGGVVFIDYNPTYMEYDFRNLKKRGLSD